MPHCSNSKLARCSFSTLSDGNTAAAADDDDTDDDEDKENDGWCGAGGCDADRDLCITTCFDSLRWLYLLPLLVLALGLSFPMMDAMSGSLSSSSSSPSSICAGGHSFSLSVASRSVVVFRCTLEASEEREDGTLDATLGVRMDEADADVAVAVVTVVVVREVNGVGDEEAYFLKMSVSDCCFFVLVGCGLSEVCDVAVDECFRV